MRTNEIAQPDDNSSGVDRRRYERVPFTGRLRLILETYNGLVSLSGVLIDISLGGCAARFYERVDAHRAGRVQLERSMAGIWLPIVTRWSRCDDRGWKVGMEFDRPTPEKLDALQRLIESRAWTGRSR